MADAGLDELAQTRVKTDDRLITTGALFRAGGLFCCAAAVGFTVTAGIGAIAPTWGLAIAEAIQRLYLAPGRFLAQYLSVQVTVTLANSLAALGASVLGAYGALLVARIQRSDAATGRSYGILGRASYQVIAGLCRAAQRCAPGLGAATHIEERAAAALAVLVPRLSVACSGCVLGIYLAGALLSGWTHHLLRVTVGLLPHGAFEIPAMIASAAVGICIAERLVAAAPLGLGHVHDHARQFLISARLIRVLALIFAAIIIGAAMEVRTM